MHTGHRCGAPVRSNRCPFISRPPDRHQTLKIRLDAIDCNIKQRNASWQDLGHEFLCCTAQRRRHLRPRDITSMPSAIIPRMIPSAHPSAAKSARCAEDAWRSLHARCRHCRSAPLCWAFVATRRYRLDPCSFASSDFGSPWRPGIRLRDSQGRRRLDQFPARSQLYCAAAALLIRPDSGSNWVRKRFQRVTPAGPTQTTSPARSGKREPSAKAAGDLAFN